MPVPENVTELGTDLAMACFRYPQQPSGRRHGPQGYAHYHSYRDWLRDEFSFRCAYCLMRENWLRGHRGFQIDHCLPQTHNEPMLEYDNLVYACPWCNQAKSAVPVPNPTAFAYGAALAVDADGTITAKSELGVVLIEGLKLDHPDVTAHRKMIIELVQLAEERNSVTTIVRLLGYPDHLPNLKTKRPPYGNTRPEGVCQSFLAKQRRSELGLIF